MLRMTLVSFFLFFLFCFSTVQGAWILVQLKWKHHKQHSSCSEVSNCTKYEHATRNIVSCVAVTNLDLNISQFVFIKFQSAKES